MGTTLLTRWLDLRLWVLGFPLLLRNKYNVDDCGGGGKIRRISDEKNYLRVVAIATVCPYRLVKVIYCLIPLELMFPVTSFYCMICFFSSLKKGCGRMDNNVQSPSTCATKLRMWNCCHRCGLNYNPLCFLLFSNSLDLLNAACEEMSQRKEKMLQTQNHFDIRPQVSPVSIFSFFSYMFKLPVPKTGTCAPVWLVRDVQYGHLHLSMPHWTHCFHYKDLFWSLNRLKFLTSTALDDKQSSCVTGQDNMPDVM